MMRYLAHRDYEAIIALRRLIQGPGVRTSSVSRPPSMARSSVVEALARKLIAVRTLAYRLATPAFTFFRKRSGRSDFWLYD